MSKTVSVLVPCFNAEKHIDATIRSIYIQDYPEIELIIIDDGSTDNSKERILGWTDRFAKKGYTLKYVYQNNRGLGGAIDTGLKYVSGEYLTLLDADDHYLPGSIYKRAQFLNEHPDYAAVRSNGWLVRGDNRRLFITSEKEKLNTDVFTALIYGETNNWAGTYMVRTDILFEFYPDRRIYPSRFGQNLQIILPIAYKRKFGYIDEPLMEYILQPNSLSQTNSAEEKFHKEEVNAQGYRDIYIHMLDLIVKDPQELQKYMNAHNASYYRNAMLRAIQYKKEMEVEAYYSHLKYTGLAALNDYIAYYSAKKSPIAILLKCVRKIKSVVK